jgi:YD repeat-containing protein
VDVANPPIAGLAGIPLADGLTEQFLYDNNLSDGIGLEASGGVARLLGSGNVSLAAALTKLAASQSSGGAGITFNASAPGSARVSINGVGEVSFSYDPAGRVKIRTDQQGDTCTYNYDLAGRLTSRSYLGRTGGPLSGQNFSDSFTYHVAGQLTGYTYPDGSLVARTYTARGQLHQLKFDGSTIDTRV